MGDDETTFARENLGLVVDGGKNVFSPVMLADIWGRPGIALTQHAQFVFVSIDPCAGSDKPINNVSDFAIVSYICDPRIIVGMDAFPTNSQIEYMPRIYAHIEKLQKHEYMKHALFVVDFESNSSMEVTHVYALLNKRFPGIIIQYSNRPNTNRIGNAILDKDKQDMVTLAQQYVNERSIYIMDNYVTTDPKATKRTGPNSREAQELYLQGLRFDRLVTVGKNGHVTGHVRFSGKVGSKKDDLVMTWMRSMYTAKCFFSNPFYAKFWYRRNPYQFQATEEEELLSAAFAAAPAISVF